VLLNCDEGAYSLGKSTNEQIVKVLKIGMRTINRIKQKCVEGGLDCALERSESKLVYEKQLIETVQEEKIEQGKDKRVDYKYIRHGMVNIFMANELLKANDW